MYIANCSPTCAFKNEQGSLYIAHLYTCGIQCLVRLKTYYLSKIYEGVPNKAKSADDFLLFEELKGKRLPLFY